MNLQTLKILQEVMKHLSFTEVANSRNVAPSSISRTISNLETELEIKLFQRSTRKLEPTEAGTIYFERVSSALNELDDAKQMAKDISNQPKGTLRVSASTVFGQMYIVPLLSILLEKHPSLNIELLLTDTYIDLIEERIDVSIRLGTLQDSSYIARKLKNMEYFICANPDYIKKFGEPTEPDQLLEHNCLLFPRSGYGNTSWFLRDSNKKVIEIPIHGNCNINNSGAIKQSTLSGMGLALLPDWLINDDLKKKKLIKLFKDYTVTATDYDSAIWLLYPSRDYLPLKTKAFINQLILEFRE